MQFWGPTVHRRQRQHWIRNLSDPRTPTTAFQSPSGFGSQMTSRATHPSPQPLAFPIFVGTHVDMCGLNTRAPGAVQFTTPAHSLINLLSTFPNRKQPFQVKQINNTLRDSSSFEPHPRAVPGAFHEASSLMGSWTLTDRLLLLWGSHTVFTD